MKSDSFKGPPLSNEREREEPEKQAGKMSESSARPQSTSAPSGSETEGKDGGQAVTPHTTVSAVKAVGEVVQGVKVIVDEAVAWAEEKVSKMGVLDGDGTGPYASPATCAPHDLDPIASGVLPAMPSPGKPKNELPGDSGQDHAQTSSKDSSGRDGEAKRGSS